MTFEVVGHDEALFEVRIQVILHHLSLPEFLPDRLFRICLVLQKADGIRVPLPEAVYVLEFPALNEQLDLVAD